MVYLSVCSLVGSVSVMAIKVRRFFVRRLGVVLKNWSSADLVGIRCCFEIDFCREQPIDTYKYICLCGRCRRLYLGPNGMSPYPNTPDPVPITQIL